MKIAIAGKGGVGKTTIAGTLARFLSRDGYTVLAVDADPAMNLAYSLGVPADEASKIIPLSENEDLIEERTGARPGTVGGSMLTLTPRVDDIADRYGVRGADGTRLLVMGTVKSAGAGCMCPSNSLLRALMRHVIVEKEQVVVMDMEAGLEHLGRGTIKGVNALLNVVEARSQSIMISSRIMKLASGLGVHGLLAVGNKILDRKEDVFLKEELAKAGIDLIGVIPFDERIAEADMARKAPLDFAPESPAVQAIKDLETSLKERFIAGTRPVPLWRPDLNTETM
jgi:CO dehydrogenase maturation factor